MRNEALSKVKVGGCGFPCGMKAYFKSKFTGLTGDNYGAINEVAEVAVLIMICLLVQAG